MNKIIRVSIAVALIFAISSIGFANATPRLLKECNMVYWTSDDPKELPVPGNQVSDFKLTLNGNTDPNFWYYLDIKFIKPIIEVDFSKVPSFAPGEAFPFYLTPPTDTAFWDWWAASPRLVTSSQPFGTWQWIMWRILHGVSNFPMFYLGINREGHYMLMDGLQLIVFRLYGLGQPVNPLRLNGDYPHGTYVFTGDTSVFSANDYLKGVTMTITFR